MPKIEFDDVATLLDALKSRYPTDLSLNSKGHPELYELIDGLCALYLDRSAALSFSESFEGVCTRMGLAGIDRG
jgi:hypothetical protein